MFMSVLLNDEHGTGFHKVIELGHCRQQIGMDNKKIAKIYIQNVM